MSEPTVRPLGWPALVLAGVVGVAAAVVGRLVLERTIGGVPAPYGTALVLVLLAAAVGLMARTARERIQRRREPVEPRTAVGWLGTARAAATAGAFALGLFGTWAATSVGRWSADLARERTIHSALAAVAGVALLVAGLALERACRVPPRDDDEEDTDDADRDPARRPGEPRDLA